MGRFTKKPVTIDAFQYTGENAIKITHEFSDMSYANIGGVFKIITLEGDMTVSPGDWIIKDVNGEFYPCKPDIFEKTYEAAHEPVTVMIPTAPIEDQPSPKERADLEPAWEMVIEEFKQRYCVGDYLTDASSVAVVRDVLDDMTARDQAGRLKYGVPLTAFNGRDQLVDAYQEALDLAVYLRAAQDEGISGTSAVYSNMLHNIFWLRVAINGRAKPEAM